ncbi:MFS transporter [Streptomyces chrestomyceticus JCM 4735]|uniref:MFS transporter n=1 Tax=Streptomyces chrestomyceticus JCM 4735 TaxID=1306181 RepID=A0A7U9KX95_9ACTN|nr:MFS transporter [Streptomyces chrestomyceticus]GCD37049.1 MFS transporter [Streptomyces chrestomyceticus JCM 4735]
MVVAVAIGGFCVQLDAFALNMTLPVVRRDLGISAAGGPWVISGYLLAAGALMPAAGRLGDLYGRRRLLLFGLALFGGSSAGCAVAPSLPLLVVFRVLQGAGGALVMPVGLALLTRSFPPGRARVATGYALGLAGLATACGPFVGGVLAEELSWRAVFWVNVPLCAGAMLCARRVVEHRDAVVVQRAGGGDVRVRWWGRVVRSGSVVVGVGVPVCLVMAVESVGVWWQAGGWAVGALGLGALFVRAERRSRAPLIDLALFRNAPYVTLTSAGAVANAATVVLLFVVPFVLQEVQGLSVLGAGTAFLVPAAAMAAAGPVAGRVPTRAAEPVTAACLGLAAAALAATAAAATTASAAVAAAAQAGAASGPALLLVAATVAAASLGVAGALTLTGTQAVVPPDRVGEASGLTKCAITVTAGLGLAPAGTDPGGALRLASAGCAAACLALLMRSGRSLRRVSRRWSRPPRSPR